MIKRHFNEAAKKKYPSPFCMRFTEEERRALELAANGRPLAAYIRFLLFKEDLPERPKRRTRDSTADPDRQEMVKLLGTLDKSRISQNINQLAKAANSLPAYSMRRFTYKTAVRFPLESLSGFKWNGCPEWNGMESVSAFPWNRCPDCSGILN